MVLSKFLPTLFIVQVIVHQSLLLLIVVFTLCHLLVFSQADNFKQLVLTSSLATLSWCLLRSLFYAQAALVFLLVYFIFLVVFLPFGLPVRLTFLLLSVIFYYVYFSLFKSIVYPLFRT